MKMTAKLDRSGFNNKLHNLRQLNYMFMQLAGHVAFFVRHQMVEQELNRNRDAKGPGTREEPVRWISGILAGSATVDLAPYSATLRMNLSQASYAKKVGDAVRKRHGYDYIALTWLRVGEAVLAAIHEEWHRAVSVIERGGKYTYENPFYAAF